MAVFVGLGSGFVLGVVGVAVDGGDLLEAVGEMPAAAAATLRWEAAATRAAFSLLAAALRSLCRASIMSCSPNPTQPERCESGWLAGCYAGVSV